MNSLRAGSICVALSLLLCGTCRAQTIDPARSTLSIEFHEMGVPVEAKFKKFEGVIDFDENHPSAAHAQFTVDMMSFDLPDPEYNEEALGPEWFDAAHYPKATFVSTAIIPSAAGKLEVRGKLTVKGKTQDVTIPISYNRQGTLETYQGALVVQRLAFGIGAGEWKDTGVLANDVSIKIRVTTPVKK